MRAVIQRVSRASVSIEGKTVAGIGRGLLVLLAVGQEDTDRDVAYFVDKVANMRIFEREGKFDLSVSDVGGEVLVISNFTLYGDVRKGRRPSFAKASPPDRAVQIYERFATELSRSVPTKTGTFQAKMEVELINDGPVTILLDSKKDF